MRHRVQLPERKGSAVHVASAVHEVMGFIDKENVILPRGIFSKKAAQIRMRVKDVIVVTDDAVRKETHVKAHLEGTDIVLFGIFLDRCPRKVVGCREKVIDGCIDPVEVALCARAGIRIALRSVEHTDFFLCRKAYILELQPLRAADFQRILCHPAADRFGGEVENLLCLALTHRLD